ncbi:hypothetical protein [Saccharicrinis aurantiacus]|uniref:hypothetical protein n=1 Tax=Saccharicrinis aurantiacus TaxID=1849719 RepID=UPI0008395D0A|nr:hypothetical protein [Saccharicrinis aurantiacus]
MKKAVTLLLLINAVLVQAQEKKVKVTPYGFVALDIMADTRESVTSRSGHVYLYPKRPEYDINGNDINANGNLDFKAAISRFGVKIAGPDAFGAKTSGVFEVDFAGKGSTDFSVRLRHAFVKLDWDNQNLILGKYWHPFFIPENFPQTVNFVVGAPIHPLSRASQVRFTQNIAEHTSVAFVMLMHGDFSSVGPADQPQMTNIPETIVQLKHKTNNLLLAATAGVKPQLPYSPTLDSESYVHESDVVYCPEFNVSAKYIFDKITVKAEAIYGGSMTHLTMIGGLAQKAKDGVAIEGEYTPIMTSAYWGDVSTNGKVVKFGVFGGVTNNLGTTTESVKADGYTRAADMGYTYMVAPRVVWYSGKMQVGLEWLYSVAAYNNDIASDYDKYSRPTNLSDVHNNRITLGMRYHF